MPARLAIGLVLGVAVVTSVGAARAATITINNVDDVGTGFNDTTSAAPKGGNDGTTVGQQRLNVFKRAAKLWGDGLESVPEIVVDASFAPLSCSANQITLGQAGATTSRANTPNAPRDVYVPIALANALAGTDLNDSEAEIEAMFNGDLVGCSMGQQDWYYGLDGNAGDDVDLLSVVLHEFGHGLGFASFIDPSDGQAAPNGFIDIFAQHVYDNGTNKSWSAMTDTERAASARNARHLVWDGQNVARQAPFLLASGAPTLTATPTPAGFTGHVSEAEFGPYVAMKSASGPLKVGTLSPIDCSVLGSVAGAVVLFPMTSPCPAVQAAYSAQTAGAVGVLIKDRIGVDPPYSINVQPSLKEYGPVTIPVLGISGHDTTLLVSASGTTTMMLSVAGNQEVGADTSGRTELFASTPVQGFSTLSHWDPLVRPDLLMEPEIASKAPHDQRMELAAFRDIGWHTVCGNGKMDPGEACDQGDQNGAAGSSCRPDCTTGTSTGSGGGPGKGSGGANGSGGTNGTGGTNGSGGSNGSGSGGSSSQDGGVDMTGGGGSSGGCHCDLSGSRTPPTASLFILVGLAVVTVRRRRRG